MSNMRSLRSKKTTLNWKKNEYVNGMKYLFRYLYVLYICLVTLLSLLFARIGGKKSLMDEAGFDPDACGIISSRKETAWWPRGKQRLSKEAAQKHRNPFINVCRQQEYQEEFKYNSQGTVALVIMFGFIFNLIIR